MRAIMVLLLTKKKPEPVWVKDDKRKDFLVTGYEYLFTNTGEVGRFALAMRVVYEKNKKPPAELRFRMENITEAQKAAVKELPQPRKGAE